jgi:biopolymer transport protein TolQ
MIQSVGMHSMWSLIRQGDAMTKFILLFLTGMSVICWSIALYKLVLFYIKNKQLNQVVNELKNVEDFKKLFIVAKKHAKTMPGYFLSQCLKHFKELLILKKLGKQEYAQGAGIDFLQMQINQSVDEILYQEEMHVSTLSLFAAVSPLLGLLGTVWGLVHSFLSISQKQSADIVTVAPGIAEALITTIAGLLIAIPALMLYFFVTSKIKEIEFQLYLLSDKMIHIARKVIVEDVLSADFDENFMHDQLDRE